MVISRETFIFWEILEFDLKINIQNYIKNSLSFSGYGNAFVFQDITDTDISLIENYVKSNLHEILQIEKCMNNEQVRFFGPFSSKPNDFFILPDAREQIFILVDYVKNTIVTKGSAHFTNSTEIPHYVFSKQSNLTESILGPIYGEDKDQTFPDSVTVKSSFEDNDTAEFMDSNLQNDTSKTHQFLSSLRATADQNRSRKKPGYRFPNDLRDFAVWFRVNAGKMVYETVQRNLELSLPSLDTTNRVIRKMDNPVVEGCLRAKELLEYLTQRELPLVVALSEDATSIEGRVQYDPKTNQVTGFTLPLNDGNGMPIPFAYPARSGMEILNHFASNNTIARYVNVIMAKPLANYPSFALLIFGSDSKFKTHHVMSRWNFIVNELKKVNIKVLTVSSDSDPRYNSAMRRSSMLGQKSNIFNADWFGSGLSELFEGPFSFQDILHILTKLRNLILRTLYNIGKLPIGDRFFVQQGHLQFLMDNFRKDQHQLTPSILNPVDKQNVGSALRICYNKVTKLLRDHLPSSEGTATFLDIMRSVVETFYDKNLTPLERVEKIWYSLFILRIWRNYVEKQKNLTVKENFLTPATYVCIEINAHSLVQLIIYLRNNELDEWFMPFLFDSQACESFFRQVRSLTTVYCRVANCSVKEIIGRVNKIHLLNDITNRSGFVFPRAQNTKDFANFHFHHLPTKEQIFETIEKCKHAAQEYAKKIGLLEDGAQPDLVCKLPSVKSYEKMQAELDEEMQAKLNEEIQAEMNEAMQTEPSEEMLAEIYEEMYVQDQIKSAQILQKNLRTLYQLKGITLKNYARYCDDEIPETSSFVEVFNDGDRRVVVKKSSLCWLFREDPGKLSSDRLQRVQGIMKHRKKNLVEQKAKNTRIPKPRKLIKHHKSGIRKPKIRLVRKTIGKKKLKLNL